MPPRQRKTTARPEPQDHLPKKTRTLADGAGLTPFQFEHDGTIYELPVADGEAAGQLAGQMVRDAVMNPDDEAAQLRLAIATVEASVNNPTTLKALYSKPWGEVGAILSRWMQASGADAGKSAASSN